MRKSIQRDLILNIINKSTSHLTAEEIYYEAKNSINNISLGTVYRNINTLVDNNDVIKIKTNEGICRYDNTLKKHHHFICKRCNKVLDVFKNINIDKDIISGVKVDDYEINYIGICSDCLKKEE